MDVDEVYLVSPEVPGIERTGGGGDRGRGRKGKDRATRD